MIDRTRTKVVLWLAAAALAPAVLGGGAMAQSRTATIALSANVNTLDPHKTATVGTDLSVISQLYSALVIRGPDLKLKGDLATSWKAVDDLTWRFELTPGVAFPNGEKLDAAAVKWNVDRVLDPKVGARIKAWFDPIQEVRVVAPTTLEIVTKAPYPALADQLSMFFLLPPQWAAQNNPAVAAMGSGPYDLKSFTSGDRAELVAKPGHFAGKPAFDTVVYRIVPEDSGRIAALLAGEVDLIDAIPPSEIKRIAASGRAAAGALTGIRFMFVKFNNLKPPFKDNRNLRLALNHAVDRQAIIDSVWAGLGTIANCQALSDAYFGYNPSLKPIPYDPAKAKQLLAAAGLAGGVDIELEVPLGRYLQAQEIAQIVAAQLGDIGVRAKIVEMEFGRWIDKYVNGRNLGNTAYLGQAWPTLDADGLLSLFEPGNVYAYYENADYKQAVEQARATTDPEKRKALYAKATEAMCADPPHIFMFHQPATYGHSNRVEWKKRGDDWMRATDLVPR